jgi:hypothetical protein
MAKGSSGSRRWIARQAIDTRPIVGLHQTPRWILLLEQLAPIGCAAIAIVCLLLGAYAYATDYGAGHL